MMMYDFHGSWEETSLVNHHSSLYSNDELNVVSYFLIQLSLILLRELINFRMNKILITLTFPL